MLSNLPLVGFIPITDAERAKKFYIDVLKLEFSNEHEHAVVLNAKGATIQLVKLDEHKPSDFTILGWETTDIVATVQALKQAGVVCEKYPYFVQDELGIWTADDRASKVAWFKDSEGNLLSVSQH
jgi:predicted enzyme related to lactoylglutathione lyase